MRIVTFIAAAALLLAGCSSTPDYSSAEDYVRDFANALIKNQSGRFTDFYLQEGDFIETEEATQLETIAMGRTRLKFLENAKRLALDLQGKRVEITDIHLEESEPLISAILKDVSEHYSHAKVFMSVDEQEWIIDITEVIKTGGEWRMTAFFTTVDLGTDDGGMVEIEVSAEEDANVTEQGQ